MWKSRNRIEKHQKVKGWGTQPAAGKLKFTTEEAQGLLLHVRGTVVLSTDPQYQAARQVSNLLFQEFPQIIVYCEVFRDVRECLAFAQRHNLWAVCRSGGHSFAGFSVNSEMVIDVSRLNYSFVNPSARRAVVGAGTNFGHLNASLDIYQLHVPGAGCEDVSIAGYMQGGGYGFTSRKFGMNCDNVVEAIVMLHDGRIVVASKRRNPDLFWAIRGGTGNNFGVLLQVTYELHQVPRLWGFGIRWPLKEAPAALVEMQQNFMRQGAPPELGYMTLITFLDNEPVMLMRGIFLGSPNTGKRHLQRLLKTPGAKLELDEVASYCELNKNLVENPVELPPVPGLSRGMIDCCYIARGLDQSDWRGILAAFKETPNKGNMILIEPYGGRINQVDKSASAFVHRDVDMDLALFVFFLNAREQESAYKFLSGFFNLVEPFSNGQKYQNYPRQNNPNYRWNYWGENFSTLLEIKRKYDPENFFHFDQSIEPFPVATEPNVNRDYSKPLFDLDPEIDFRGSRG